MKKVGFIDYFLDEWHAENYPDWIKEASDGEYQVCYAYGKIEGTDFGKRTNAQWAESHKVTLCSTIDEVIAQSDVLVVLSPDNPEQHEELSRLAMMSGKPTFIDKTFTDTKAEAERIFSLAKASNTPVYTSSALRFDAEYKKVRKDSVCGITSIGGGSFECYLIHQLEPISLFMGTEVKRVMYLGSEKSPALVMEFSDNRCATISFCTNSPFSLCINYADGENVNVQAGSGFFNEFIKELVDFFKTGTPKVAADISINLMAIRGAANKSQSTPYVWVEV